MLFCTDRYRSLLNSSSFNSSNIVNSYVNSTVDDAQLRTSSFLSELIGIRDGKDEFSRNFILSYSELCDIITFMIVIWLISISHHTDFNCCLVTNNSTLYFVHALINFTAILYCQWLSTNQDINNNNSSPIPTLWHCCYQYYAPWHRTDVHYVRWHPKTRVRPRRGIVYIIMNITHLHGLPNYQ